MSKLKILGIGALLLSLVGFTLRPAQGETPALTDSHEITRGWTTGILSDGVGPANIIVTDLEQDGVSEVITCAAGAAYALHAVGPDEYAPVWYSDYLGCTSVAVGDRDGDGIQEIYVGAGVPTFPIGPVASPTEAVSAPLASFAPQRYQSPLSGAGSKLYIFAGDTFALLNTLSLPEGTTIQDMVVGNVDGDEEGEIVFVNPSSTFVLNATSGAVEWNAQGFGGSNLAIGNLDADADIEIVVAGSNGYVLNAVSQSQEWNHEGGFGADVSVGDVDGDGMDEIAYIEDWTDVYVLDGDTHAVKWHRNDFLALVRVLIADVNGVGNAEVVLGDGQWGGIQGYDGNTGAGPLWSVVNPEYGVFGLSVGDTDNDGTNEILWGAGLSSSGSDRLLIGEWDTGAPSWRSEDLDGPLKVASGDLDNDGQVEIVMATTATNSYYDGGTIHVYDGTTHTLEWSTVVPGNFYNLSHLQVGQLDSDAALEILVGGNNWDDTRLSAYDGVTHELQWQSPVLGDDYPIAMQIAQLDQDAQEEIIIGLSNQRVQVLDGTSSTVEWDSGVLDSLIYDVALGDLDGDNTLDLAILTAQSVYVYEVGTWTVQQRPFSDGIRVAIVNDDLSGAGELLLAALPPFGEAATLHAWRGSDYHPLWQQNLGPVYLAGIEPYEVDGDGQQEFLLYGTRTTAGVPNSSSYFVIGAQTPTGYHTEYQLDRNLNAISNALIANLDQESAPELLLGAMNSIQVNEFRAAMQVNLTGPSQGAVTSAHTFTATALPLSDTLPITFSWSATDQEPITRTGGLTDSVPFTWDSAGTKTVTVTAQNTQGQATATHTIEILVAPTSVTLDGPVQGLPIVAHTFLAESLPLNASIPLTYTWEATGQPPITHQAGLTDTATFAWLNSGPQTVTVTVSNGFSTAQAVQQIEIGHPITTLTLDGADQGLPNQPYAYTVSLAPQSATMPVTYTWNATDQEPLTRTGGLTDTVRYTWTTPGTKTITITATNRLGSVTITRTVQIEPHRLYLPVVSN